MNDINVIFKTTNITIAPDLKGVITEKVSTVSKFLTAKKDGEAVAHVEIEKVAGEHHKHGNIFRVEINLQHYGQSARVEATKEDVLSAVEDAVNELVRIVRHTKERKIDLVRRGGAALKKMLRFGKDQ